MKRENISLLFEIKNYNRNIPTSASREVDKFIRDVSERNICGIMMSISTGICNKYNYQIDIINNNICLYIHDMNYDPDKIKLGVDIIDNLHSKLKLKNTNDITIDENTLELINKEYQIFIQKRETAINHIKDSSKKTIQYIEEIELSNLNQLLLSQYSFNNTSGLECDICRKFVGSNLKSLAGHKKKCKGFSILIESETSLKPLHISNSPEETQNINNLQLEKNEKRKYTKKSKN